MSILIINDLSNIIINGQKKNSYSNLNNITNLYGVYIFQNKLTNEILYVGKAEKQTLKERVRQHFVESDTGGTFKSNYINIEKSSFDDYSNFIKNVQIIAIACQKNNFLISKLESILINVLKPKYNKNI